jgi:4-amino-4-deoxy-L-arabinose transferase-like glycosyltransferase
MTERSFRRLAALVGLAAALHGALYIPLVGRNEVTDSRTYVAGANSILDGSYSTPLLAGFYYVYPDGFFDITGLRIEPTVWQAPEHQALRPPGYPLYLAAFGGGDAGVSRWLALLGQAALVGAATGLLALTVRRWWGPRIGLASAVVYALDPYSKHYVALVLSEALAGALVIAGAYAFTRAWEERSAPWWTATAAAAAGLTLVRAAFALAVPLVLLAALVRGPRLRGALATGLCSAALLAPWLAWTTHATGKPVLADWGEGYNLLLAAHGEGLGRTSADVANDRGFLGALRSAHRLAPTTAELASDPGAHPHYLERADEHLRGLARERYRHRLRHEPEHVAWETLYRAFFLWDAHEDWYQPDGVELLALRAADWIVLLLALAGAALALRRGGPPRVLVVFLLVYTGVLAVHHVEARFGIPLRGLYLSFAVLALAAGLESSRSRLR